jgi:bacillithiol system protein YtxJ
MLLQHIIFATMNWIKLDSENQLDEIREKSTTRPQVIFKHSTRCSTSALVKNRLERNQPPDSIDFYYLDLINFRPISNKVSDTFMIHHESPQVLLIRDGKCVYDESHMGITMDEIVEKSDSF